MHTNMTSMINVDLYQLVGLHIDESGEVTICVSAGLARIGDKVREVVTGHPDAWQRHQLRIRVWRDGVLVETRRLH